MLSSLFFKMFFPTFNDNIGIIVDYLLDFFIVIGFDTLFLREFKLSTIPFELGHSAIALDMYVQRVMFFAIEEERKTEKSKYFWHNILIFIISSLQR